MPATLERTEQEAKPLAEEQSAIRSRRRGLQGRARAAVLAGVLLFVFSQVGMRVGIEEFRPELRDPSFELKYRQRAQLIEETKPAPAVVVSLGSSMTVWGINARQMEEPLAAELGRPVIAFNLANNGAGPLTQLLYTQRLLRRGIRPDLVVLELTPLNYSNAPAPHDMPLHPTQTLDRYDVETVSRRAPQGDLGNAWWESYLVPIYGHRLPILNKTAPIMVPFDDRLDPWQTMDARGWRRWDAPAPEMHDWLLKRVKREYPARLENYQVGQAHVQTLREVTDLLARERIATVMVLMPEGPTFQSLYAPDALTPLFEEFAAISRQHGFRFVSARDWLGEEKFIDSHHATHEGATELTARLLKEAIVPTMSAARYAGAD